MKHPSLADLALKLLGSSSIICSTWKSLLTVGINPLPCKKQTRSKKLLHMYYTLRSQDALGLKESDFDVENFEIWVKN